MCNYLARVVTKSTRFSDGKPLRDRLHWLPIAAPLDFRIHKLVHLKQPQSLAKHLHLNIPHNDQLFLQYPCF